MEKYEHAVVEVGAMAGDVVIFTETATHVRCRSSCVLPCSCSEPRLLLAIC